MEDKGTVALWLFVVNIVIAAVSLFGFIYLNIRGRRRVSRGESLQKPARSILVVTLLAVGTIFVALSTTAIEIIGRTNIRCFFSLGLFRVGLLLSTLPIVTNLLMHSSRLYLVRRYVSSQSATVTQMQSASNMSLAVEDVPDASACAIWIELFKYFFFCGSTFVYGHKKQEHTAWETYRSTRLSSADVWESRTFRTSSVKNVARGFSVDENSQEISSRRVLHSPSKSSDYNSSFRSANIPRITSMDVASTRATSDEKFRKQINRRSRFFTRWPLTFGIVSVATCGLIAGTFFELSTEGLLGVDSVGCVPKQTELVVEALLVLFIGTWLLLATHGLRHEPDPFKIVADAKIAAMVMIIFIFMGLVLMLVNPEGLDMAFDWSYLIQLGSLLIFLIVGPVRSIATWTLNRTPALLARRGRRKTHATPNADVDHVDLEVCLQSPTGLRFFERHLIDEVSVETLYFWLDAKRWQRRYRNYNLTTQERALDIYNTFIMNGGLLEINLSHRIRNKIKSEFDHEQFVDRDVFDEAALATFRLMRSDSYLRFTDSIYYQKWRAAGGHGSEESATLSNSPKTMMKTKSITITPLSANAEYNFSA